MKFSKISDNIIEKGVKFIQLYILFVVIFVTAAILLEQFENNIPEAAAPEIENARELKIELRQNFSDEYFLQDILISNNPVYTNHESIKLVQSETKLGNSFLYSMQISDQIQDPSLEIFEVFDDFGNSLTEYFFFFPKNIELPEQEKSIFCKNPEVIDLFIELDKYECITEAAGESIPKVNFTYEGITVEIHELMFEDLKKMLNAANKDEISLQISSSHRDYEDQIAIVDLYKKKYGNRQAEKLSAEPGHSEHHTGLALDFTSEEMDVPGWVWFGDTEAFKWLDEHAWKYGFVLSYPEGGEEITGYSYEPWHWRYIGPDHAKILRQIQDLTLKEYLYVANAEKENSY